MKVLIIRRDNKLYATRVVEVEGRIEEQIMLLPEGEPFMGVAWEDLEPGLVIEPGPEWEDDGRS